MTCQRTAVRRVARLALLLICAAAHPAAPPAAAGADAPAGDAIPIASFERDADGFTGFARDEQGAQEGKAAGRLDNTGKPWVTASKDLSALGRDVTGMTFWVRSTDADPIAVRLVDATKQTFQVRVPFKRDGTWQQVRVTQFERGQSWGGAGDKRVHGPAASIAFVWEHKGTIWVDDVRVNVAPGGGAAPPAVAAPTGAPAAGRPPSTVRPPVVAPAEPAFRAPLGNIFTVGQPVAVVVETTGDVVDWKVTDFWQNEVAAGTSPVAQGRAVVRPAGVTAAGYYLVRATPKQGGRSLPERMTSFAIVRPPPATPPRDPAASPFGVMTHFAQGMSPEILPALKQAGIAAVRDEHYWAEVERTPGTFAFGGKSDQWMAACREAGVLPLIAMTFGNPHYDNGDNPWTPNGRQGYANYGKAILDRYGDQVRWLEVWNEYNGTWLKGPAKDDPARAYAEMLKVTYQQVKKARPDVQVLGGAAVLIPLPYFEGIFQNQGLQHMDAVVIHPYRSRPEGVEREVAELQALIRKFNKGKDKPIWVTETGRKDMSEHPWETGRQSYELGRANAARYLARQYTLLLSQGVAKVFWYLATDHREFVTMGLLRGRDDAAGMGAYAVTPVYAAYATLIRQLDGARFVRREAAAEYSRVRVYCFERGASPGGGGTTAPAAPVRVCWATRPAVVRLAAAGPLTVVDLVGGERTLTPKNGFVELALSESATYVNGAVKSVEELPGPERVIADSLDDYSKKQGENDWYYGYFDGSGKGQGNGVAPSGPYTDDDFKPMAQKQTTWGYEWGCPVPYVSVSGGDMHPGKSEGRDVCPVARWTSRATGPARVRGSFGRISTKGDGVTVQVLLDGKVVFTQDIGGDGGPRRAELDAPVQLKRGSLLDVCVRPRGSAEFDATSYEVRVVQLR